jgi:ABC-type bacteriocin/lantibiotic exporter with double-glycine peptidase domain
MDCKKYFFKFLNQKIKIERKINITDLKNIRNEMTKSEIDHLFAFVFELIFITILYFKQNYLFAVMLLVNIAMNLYPSLLQNRKKKIETYF